MIGVLLSVLITILSLLTAFFLSIANISHLLEADIVAAAKNNAFLHSLNVGQIYYRSMVLKNDHDRVDNGKYGLGSMREDHNQWSSNYTANVSFSVTNAEEQGKIKVNLDIK